MLFIRTDLSAFLWACSWRRLHVADFLTSLKVGYSAIRRTKAKRNLHEVKYIYNAHNVSMNLRRNLYSYKIGLPMLSVTQKRNAIRVLICRKSDLILYSVKTLPFSGHSNASSAQLAVCCRSERSFITPGACRLNHAIMMMNLIAISTWSHAVQRQEAEANNIK